METPQTSGGASGAPFCASTFNARIRVAYNRENTGFAGGQNQAISLSKAAWILTLNPDTRLTPGFLGKLVEAGEADPSVGSVCGKLLAMSPDFEPLAQPTFDSTGIYFTPNQRHFDRGSQQPDHGQYERPEYVFGATGAACLYRRAMIDDISIDGEFFDSDFFVYREDADVAWRAQLMGWSCIYAPLARGYHVRNVLPGNRRALPPEINMHSVKNRFLMRLKNITGDLYRRNWLSITTRDLVVVGCCLVREQSSLKALGYVAKNWRRVVRKRHEIMRRIDVEKVDWRITHDSDRHLDYAFAVGIADDFGYAIRLMER